MTDVSSQNQLVENENETKKFNPFELLSKIVNHKIFFVATIINTLIKMITATFLSSAIQLVGWQTGTVFGIVSFSIYFICYLFVLIEIILRLVVNRKEFFFKNGIQWLNILDLIIISVDVVSSTLALTFFIFTEATQIYAYYSFLGGIIVLRLLIFTSYHPKLRRIGFALRKSMVTILIMMTFLLLLIYFNAMVAYSLYSDYSDKDFDLFVTPYQSFFTMIQVISGDSWAEAIARPAEAKLKGTAYVFFIIVFCETAFIMSNVVTGIILDAIAHHQGDEDEEEETKEKEKKEEIKTELLSEKLKRVTMKLEKFSERIKKLENKTIA